MDKPPDEAALHEAALLHLGRFAATEAGLLQVLRRRVQRWAARARAASDDPDAIAAQIEAGQAAASAVVRRLAAVGAVDDAAFAASRAARLSRAGRSRRVIAAHLAARGIDRETAGSALSGGHHDEFAAAIMFARRRRIGPFRPEAAADADAQAATRQRDLAALARAGFPHEVALRVLATTTQDGEAMVETARRG